MIFGTVEAGVVTGIAYVALNFYDEPLQKHFRLRAKLARP